MTIWASIQAYACVGAYTVLHASKLTFCDVKLNCNSELKVGKVTKDGTN